MSIKDIIYIAAVIKDKESLNKKYFTHPVKYAHHCTIQFGNIPFIPEFVGSDVNFVAEEFFDNNMASAISGYLDNTDLKRIMEDNKQKAHITISCEFGVKPVYSNQLIINELPKEKINNLIIPCKVGAYCLFDNGKLNWVY